MLNEFFFIFIFYSYSARYEKLKIWIYFWTQFEVTSLTFILHFHKIKTHSKRFHFTSCLFVSERPSCWQRERDKDREGDRSIWAQSVKEMLSRPGETPV